MAVSARSPARPPDAGVAAVRPAVPRFAAWLRERFPARWQWAIRSRILPAELRSRLTLSRGELILAAGLGPDDRYVLVATDRALHHLAGADGWCRLGWELITGVRWDSAAGRLVITGLAGAAPPHTAVPLRDCGTMLELADERITHTRLGSWTVMAGGQRRVLAEARRRPVTGDLLWIVSSRDGLDLSGQQARGQIGKAVTRLREELGIPQPPGAGHGLLLTVAGGPPRGGSG